MAAGPESGRVADGHVQGALRELRRLVEQDIDRYLVLRPHRSRWRVPWSTHGARASAIYRLGHWLLSSRSREGLHRRVLWWAYLVLVKVIEMTTGISIAAEARIGSGLYIGHFGCIVVGGGVVMGTNCNLSQGVTIGEGGRPGSWGSPRIGNRVYLAPGAKVFGPIVVGDDVAIGANAVVTQSLPDRAVAVGVPAQIVSYRGSFDFVRYFGMEGDPERARSLLVRDTGA